MNTSDLFVSDLDGTLLTSKKRVSGRTKSIVRQFIAQGGLFSVATARSLTSCEDFVTALGIQLPVIVFNGAFVYDPVAKTNLVSRYLDSALAEEWLRRVERRGLNPVIHTVTHAGSPRVHYRDMVNQSERAYLEDRLERGDPRFRQTDELRRVLDEENVVELMIVGTRAELGALHEEAAASPDLHVHYGEDLYCPDFCWLELVHPRANKSDALRFLKEHLGAPSVTCFGDNLNDLDMFAVADTSCAVANAHPRALAAADHTIKSNDEDGVVRYLAGLA